MYRIAPAYRNPLLFSLALQTPIVILFSIMLDGGTLATLALIAACGYWAGVIIILLRRKSPTGVDLFFVRWGYLLLALAEFFLLVVTVE